MLEQIRALLDELGSGNDRSPASADEADVAAVALFFQVIGADGVIDPAEIKALRAMISEEYGDREASVKALFEAGAQADREAVDLFAFTSILNRRLDAGGKSHFIELLWRLAFADGHRHELEDHVVWRIADLMGVSNRERVLARQRALADAALNDPEAGSDGV